MEVQALRSRALAATYTLAMLVSCVPWVLSVIYLSVVKASNTEGILMLLTLVGLCSYVIVGPAVAGALTILDRLSMVAFIGAYLIASLPILSFQTFAYSASVMSVFIRLPVYHVSTEHVILINGALAVSIYMLYLVVVWAFGRKRIWPTVLIACALSGISMLIAIIRLMG